MIFDNEFTCPENHTFKANAKLRARCPQCGKLSRRFSKINKVVTANDSEPTEQQLVSNEQPVAEPPTLPTPERVVKLIKQGRPRVMPTRKLPARVNGRFVSAKKAVKKAVVRTTPKTGIVKSHVVKGKITPKITRKPSRTAVARHIGEGGLPKSYTDMMIESSRY